MHTLPHTSVALFRVSCSPCCITSPHRDPASQHPDGGVQGGSRGQLSAFTLQHASCRHAFLATCFHASSCFSLPPCCSTVCKHTKTVLNPASNSFMPQVPPLSLPVRLLPCSVGDSLLPGWGPDLPGGQPAWTSCQACGADQVGLWRDERQQLGTAAAAAAGGSGDEGGGKWDAAGLTSDQLNATVQTLLVRGLNGNGIGAGAATCRNCPAGAQCPGGAVLVPLPGFWHSAANSTALHRCPYPPACGEANDGESAGDTPWDSRASAAGTGVPAGLAQDRPRSRALAACQAAWYASSWRPGLWVVAGAAARGLLGQRAGAGAAAGNGSSGGQRQGPGEAQQEGLPCLLWYEPSLLEENNPAAAAAALSGAPRARVLQTSPGGTGGNSARSEQDSVQLGLQQQAAWSNLSYTQLQCADGYTGNLCAACQPGYYLQPGFQCEQCPGVGRTVLLGLLAFAGSVGLVLLTAAANLGRKKAASGGGKQLGGRDASNRQRDNAQVAAGEEEASGAEILKVGSCVHGNRLERIHAHPDGSRAGQRAASLTSLRPAGPMASNLPILVMNARRPATFPFWSSMRTFTPPTTSPACPPDRHHPRAVRCGDRPPQHRLPAVHHGRGRRRLLPHVGRQPAGLLPRMPGAGHGQRGAGHGAAAGLAAHTLRRGGGKPGAVGCQVRAHLVLHRSLGLLVTSLRL